MEDANGWIWIGTSSGVFIVKDLTQIGYSTTSGALKAVRPKVARNDGTNYADYLLSTDNILWMACDASNRKWLATESSGIYLVSEDGTEILEEFNEDNSPLLSNTVEVVACDPNGNDVLMATPEGMFIYSSTSSPAADDYSEVYAYPNPVRPDYTGWITINGLMENSLVKISDMSGNVFWEGTSEGGMVVWDGCNRDGSRVKSGVYLVYASQTSGDSNSGVVTKIVVVN
jgi:ligand-binding sensor domain-containing protein